MRTSLKKKMGFAFIAIAVAGLSLWFGFSQASVQTNSPVTYGFHSGLISARHAFDAEVERARNATTLISLDPLIVSHMPKLKEVFDGADSNYQKLLEFCGEDLCDGRIAIPPVPQFATMSVNELETSTILNSLVKLDYFEEHVTDDSATLVRFYQAAVEYNGKYYYVTMDTVLKA